MNGMEAMAINVLSKMMGVSPEQMGAQVMGLIQTMNELNSRLALIEGNTATALEIVKEMQDGNRGPSAGSGRGRKSAPAIADASAAN